MRARTLLPVVLVAACAVGAGACGENEESRAADRATVAIDTCRDNGGVTAFDDDAIICGDGTTSEERGATAVAACRAHGGVSAFDDNIVICRDQSFQRAEGG